MTHGSACAGIGGFDLGFERAGIKTIWQIEKDAYRRAVLARHFPAAERYADIRHCGAGNLAAVDILSCGFPCQPVSTAGRRRGTADPRWLWPEVARLIRELRPRWVVLENVPGLLHRGMGDVLGSLAACRYDAEWDVLSAAAFGAPHWRYRVFIVAYASEKFLRFQQECQPGRSGSTRARNDGADGHVADRDNRRRQESSLPAGRRTEGQGAVDSGRHGANVSDAVSERCAWRPCLFQTARENGGISPERNHPWAVEPDVGRVAHGVPSRVDRVAALGEAVIPQATKWIAQRIIATEEELKRC